MCLFDIMTLLVAGGSLGALRVIINLVAAHCAWRVFESVLHCWIFTN